MINNSFKKVFITGTAGFIGFHLSRLLLSKGYIVHGFDGMTDYYDVELKKRRNEQLLQNQFYDSTISMLEDHTVLNSSISKFKPDVIIHLAAQAGVRYSIENPKAYIDSNIIGTFNILEAAKEHNIKHLLMASTSSVYGGNIEMPFSEQQKADTQLTLYAATKKANESMAHSYAHLWDIPVTMFRFLLFMAPGVGQIWPSLSLYQLFWMIDQ